MLLYLQPLKNADERRCFVSDPARQEDGLVELKTDSLSVAGAPEENSPAICVHLTPPVISIYLSRE